MVPFAPVLGRSHEVLRLLCPAAQLGAALPMHEPMQARACEPAASGGPSSSSVSASSAADPRAEAAAAAERRAAMAAAAEKRATQGAGK